MKFSWNGENVKIRYQRYMRRRSVISMNLSLPRLGRLFLGDAIASLTAHAPTAHLPQPLLPHRQPTRNTTRGDLTWPAHKTNTHFNMRVSCLECSLTICHKETIEKHKKMPSAVLPHHRFSAITFAAGGQNLKMDHQIEAEQICYLLHW